MVPFDATERAKLLLRELPHGLLQLRLAPRSKPRAGPAARCEATMSCLSYLNLHGERRPNASGTTRRQSDCCGRRSTERHDQTQAAPRDGWVRCCLSSRIHLHTNSQHAAYGSVSRLPGGRYLRRQSVCHVIPRPLRWLEVRRRRWAMAGVGFSMPSLRRSSVRNSA
jgi:hypothetical protein